jgi:hypothetical protein
MKTLFSGYPKACLTALLMLVCSLSGRASTYDIEMGELAQGSNRLLNQNGAAVWTYATSGDVGNLSYSADANVLSFYLSPSTVAENSLTLTSVQSFSGKLGSIIVSTSQHYGLIIKAYVGQTELGELTYNEKTEEYDILRLSHNMRSEQITLKFMASPNAPNGAGVSDLSKVSLSISDAVVPLSNGDEVTFIPSLLMTANLSNYSYRGILFTLNEAGGDGFENEDGGIYLESTLTDARVAALNTAVANDSYAPGDDGYAVDFAGGITMMVAKGKGTIKIEAATEPAYAYHVKIGNNAPVEVASTTRQWLEIPYAVSQDTYVYIYLVSKAAVRESGDSGRAGTRIGRREKAHGVVYSVKCACAPMAVADVHTIADYIMGRNPAGFIKGQADVTGDGRIDVADLVKVIQMVSH